MRNFNVKVNGKTYYVEVEETNGTGTAEQPAQTSQAQPQSQPQPKAQVDAGATVVVSPFPGLILYLSVQPGATVKKGDKILVLEAMKMQHDITAGANGTVSFLIKKGDTVETGTQLAFIK